MGLARLSKVTVIAPRSEYHMVADSLARFQDFHAVGGSPDFDPRVQELAVRYVRLFAQADQAVKDLGIQLMPGTIDIVFRGVKIPHDEFEGKSWDEFLIKAETDLAPIVEEVRVQRAALQKAAKEEADAENLKGALEVVSSFSVDLSKVQGVKRMRIVLTIVQGGTAEELRKSLPEAIFMSHVLSPTATLVLLAVGRSDEGKLDKAMKLLEAKPLLIPLALPQNPAEAYRKLTADLEAARTEKHGVEAWMDSTRRKNERKLLAIRELAEAGREVLDEARVSGPMGRLAMTSGYIPSKKEGEFKTTFGNWMVYSEPTGRRGHDSKLPTLMENPVGVRIFQLITSQQGTAGGAEVDPTPLVSFVFPIFFGLMFGDFGHGIILTLFALLIRQRGRGALRQWGNIFLICGVSATIFGALVGEFFGSALNLYQVLSPVTLPQLEILEHNLGVDAPVNGAIQNVMIIAILVGIVHLITGLSLDVYEGLKEGETAEVIVSKLPTLTMYISGVGYGIAFIGAKYSFNVLKPAGLDPLFKIPNNQLGGASLAVLLVSMLVIFCGKAVAIRLGKMHGESVAGALSNGGLEVFERISQFLSNTISYVRLAIMLLVHAVLLLIVNKYFPITNPFMILPWVFFNCLIIAFEAFVVYVQDLRLHVYEFFTKFYRGTGIPFRKIFPDRERITIKWLTG